MDSSVEKASVDFTKYFYWFKYKCLFVVKFNQEKHGAKYHFTLSNKFDNQSKQINDSKELNHPIAIKASLEGFYYKYKSILEWA